MHAKETEPPRGNPLSVLLRQWEREGRRGFKVVRAGVISTLDLLFTERELLRLRSRLDKVNQHLSQVYREIGEKMATIWVRGGDDALSDEERTKHLNEVRRLQETQREILRQIQEWEG